MNEGVRKTALWLRDLLGYDESFIRIGRQNFNREDLESPYIVVDSMGGGSIKSSGYDFDGETEQETHDVLYSLPVTLNFYGPDAHETAMRLVALRQSQESTELQRTYRVVVHAPETITDAKALTGQEYGERIEVALNVEYQHTETIDRRRIDTPQIETPLEN